MLEPLWSDISIFTVVFALGIYLGICLGIFCMTALRFFDLFYFARAKIVELASEYQLKIGNYFNE